MKKTLPYLATFAAGFVLALLLLKGCGEKPKSNETQNIETATDSLKVIQEAKAPLQAQIAEKEVIISDLQRTVKQLEGMNLKGDRLAGVLASRLKEAEAKLKKESAELTRLTLLLSETKASATVALEEQEREGIGMEIGEDLPPIYVAEALEPNGWYKLNATFDTYADTAKFDLMVRNDFEVAEFTENGISKFRVTNKNPYTFSLPGTNVFDLKPVTAPVEKKHRFGLGLQGGVYAIREFNGGYAAGYGVGIGLFYRLL